MVYLTTTQQVNDSTCIKAVMGGGGSLCIEQARNISAEANLSAILNYRQVSCDCPFEGINPSTAQF